MTKEDAQKLGYKVRDFEYGFLLCDYSGTKEKYGIAFKGVGSLYWDDLPYALVPFETEELAWAAVE